MQRNRPSVLRGRHFQDEVIVLCVRWYLRYSLSYRDLEELRAEPVCLSIIQRLLVGSSPILTSCRRRDDLKFRPCVSSQPF